MKFWGLSLCLAVWVLRGLLDMWGCWVLRLVGMGLAGPACFIGCVVFTVYGS